MCRSFSDGDSGGLRHEASAGEPAAASGREHVSMTTTEDVWVLVSLAPWGRGVAIAAVAVTLVALWLAWRASAGDRLSRRLTLIFLRFGAAIAALVLFFQPALRRENLSHVPNHVAVLVDESESMRLSEDGKGPSRAERARNWLNAEQAALAKLAPGHKLDFYGFSSALQPTTLPSLLSTRTPPTGDATRLREALAQVRSRYEGRDLGGVLLITDGIDTERWSGGLASDDIDFLKGLGAPVHAGWVGRPGLTDVAIARVLADDFAFVRTAVKVEAVVRVVGGDKLAGRQLPIVLRRDGEPIQTVPIVLRHGQSEYRVVFPFTPERVGQSVYEISAPVVDGEAIVENNARSFLLRVIRDKVRVLLVAGRPSWDERFLRGLFKHDPNVDLISFFILRTPDDVEAVSSDELSLIPFPTEELFQEQLRSFDVVFMQNFNFGPYGLGTYLDEIQRYVEDGGGFAMLGGDLSFDLGGYGGTPIASILPVELFPPGTPGDRLVDLNTFKLRLTGEGKSHPITALRADLADNEARWAELPELGGTNLLARAKPGSTVLAVHPTRKDADGKPLPVLTVGEAGKGRTLALTTDSTWRWVFSGGAVCEGVSCGDRERVYQRFWENTVRWLIHDPSLSLLRVDAGQSYKRGESPLVTVKALRPDYQPAPRVEVAVTITRIPSVLDTGPVSQPCSFKVTTGDSGEARHAVDPLGPGGYRVVATAKLGGREVTSEAVFLVAGAGRELEDAEARRDLVDAVAKETGGEVRREGTSLAGLRFLPPQAARVNRHHDVELWSRWWVLLVAATCLALEWTLRRRWGRV
jgi:uncharacterized membrane protein